MKKIKKKSRKKKLKIPQRITHGINPDEITADDSAIVQDFYDNACHDEWCEFDETLLQYLAARSRLNGGQEAIDNVKLEVLALEKVCNQYIATLPKPIVKALNNLHKAII